MIILDENIPESQWQLLRSWSEKGITDEDLTGFLIQQPRPTFFTRDDDFYDKRLCHSRYCLVYLVARPNEAASFARRLLRHPLFKTRAQRLGCVIRVPSSGLQMWRLREPREIFLSWND